MTALRCQLTVIASPLSFNLAAVVPCTRGSKSPRPFSPHLPPLPGVYPGTGWKPSAVAPVLILPFDTDGSWGWLRTVAGAPRQAREIHPASSRRLFKGRSPSLTDPGAAPARAVRCSLPRRPCLPLGVLRLGVVAAPPQGVRGRGHQPTRDVGGERGAAADKAGRRPLRLPRPLPPRALRGSPGAGACLLRGGRCRPAPGRRASGGRGGAAEHNRALGAERRPPARTPSPAGWLRARRTWRRRWGGTLYLSTGPTASARTGGSSSSSKGAPAGGGAGGRGAGVEGGPAPAAARLLLSSLPPGRAAARSR